MLIKAMNGLSESEQVATIQDKFKEDPIRFIIEVILPLVPKDEIGQKISKLGNQLGNPNLRSS